MQKLTKEISNKFANMALVCAMLVVFMHLPTTHSPAAAVFRDYFSEGLCRIAVPFFFVAGGFFLAGRFDEPGWYRTAVVKRLRTLIVPLILWSVLWFAWRVGIQAASNVIAHRPIETKVDAMLTVTNLWRVLAIHPLEQPMLGVMWFVRTLFVMVLLSPGLRKLATPVGVLALWCVHGLVVLMGTALHCPLALLAQDGIFSLAGVTYFTLGLYLRKSMKCLEMPKWALPFGLLLWLVRGLPSATVCSHVLAWLFIPLLLAGVWAWTSSREWPRGLTSLAFPIYVLHMFVILVLEMQFCSALAQSLLGFILQGVVAIVGSMIGAVVLKRSVPKLARIAFGGR